MILCHLDFSKSLKGRPLSVFFQGRGANRKWGYEFLSKSEKAPVIEAYSGYDASLIVVIVSLLQCL